MLATARAFVALLIAVSLTFAPFAAAQAKRAPHAGEGMAASHTASGCHKAAHHRATPAGRDNAAITAPSPHARTKDAAALLAAAPRRWRYSTCPNPSCLPVRTSSNCRIPRGRPAFAKIPPAPRPEPDPSQEHFERKPTPPSLRAKRSNPRLSH